MDNQQPSVSAFEFGWFCGLIDGEGCIGLWSRGGERRHEFKPGLRLSNTSKTIIDAYCNVLDRLGVPYHVTHYEGRNERCKEYWTVAIEGLKRLNKILPLIKDVLVCKKKQALLVWEWVEGRAKKWHRSEYSERELEIPKIVSEMNYRGQQK